ncbi:MAG: GNAT family N-acetyltransferase [Negativicutes bacterium]|nr:GNAT family N-acetyltransferase [Negativicutes bacterium]
MYITEFTAKQIPQAQRLVLAEYRVLQSKLPWLPEITAAPNLDDFAANQLGVAALEGGCLLGFLCCSNPFPDAFHTTGAKGSFTPLHAHAAIEQDRAGLYDHLYQAAARKWVAAGIVSHAICFYSHDQVSLEQFFWNGFGMRCLDAIKENTAVPDPQPALASYYEVAKTDLTSLLAMQNQLIAHLGNSPCFMKYAAMSEERFLVANEENYFFAAQTRGKPVAYLRFSMEGENFISNCGKVINISGAFCLPEFRGSGIIDQLLDFSANFWYRRGYRLLGVDCESINPTARRYWLKHFTPYTYSLVRRIDEKAAGCTDLLPQG